MTDLQPTHRLDRSVRSFDGGRVLLGGSPARLFRLTESGARWLDDLLAGTGVDDSVAGRELLTRLVTSGLLHPVPRAVSGPARPAVTMVVPVRDRPEALAALLTSVERSGERPDEIVVVDDGSTDADAHRVVCAAHGARLERTPVSRGPGAARDLGLDLATNDLVVFVDSDVTVPTGWLGPLLGHLDDDTVVAVAGRIRSAPGAGRLAGHDRRDSPLDLGEDPGPVGPGRRVGHVPAALLLVRREAHRSVGGFDPGLRVGEDVDLVWRLVAAGGVVRYEPDVVAEHRPRSDLRSWCAQRFGYGTSAAALDERHPGSVTPWRSSRWSLVVLLPLVAGHPAVAAAAALVTSVSSARRLSDVPPTEAVRLALTGHLSAATSAGRAAVRVWWPLLVPLVLFRPTRRVALRLLGLWSVGRWWNRGAPLRVGDLPLALLDDVAYGSGVWVGCARRGRWGPLRPTIDP